MLWRMEETPNYCISNGYIGDWENGKKHGNCRDYRGDMGVV